jgi:hypothetical protein
MTKVIGIIEDNRITGVVYGEIEIVDKTLNNKNFFNSAIKNAKNIKALKILQQRTKQK